jgi:hypothetical protein
MLQRTTEAPAWPERLDYLAVERIAREVRSQYVASLINTAKNALARRFAGGRRVATKPAR